LHATKPKGSHSMTKLLFKVIRIMIITLISQTVSLNCIINELNLQFKLERPEIDFVFKKLTWYFNWLKSHFIFKM